MLRIGGRRLSTTARARKVLGLSPVGVSSASELKAAFRRRALETHPDRGGSSEGFREVSQAYSSLARHLHEQSDHPNSSTATGRGGVPEDWAPTEEEFQMEFRKWNKQRMEEEAEEERRHQQEAADAVPKFFTWRLGLRVLVTYLIFRATFVLIWVNLPGHHPGRSPQALEAQQCLAEYEDGAVAAHSESKRDVASAQTRSVR